MGYGVLSSLRIIRRSNSSKGDDINIYSCSCAPKVNSEPETTPIEFANYSIIIKGVRLKSTSRRIILYILE